MLVDYANGTTYVGDRRYRKRDERVPQLEAALAAARRVGRTAAVGGLLGSLGNAYAALGDAERTIDYHERLLKITRELGDRAGEVKVLGILARIYEAAGDPKLT